MVIGSPLGTSKGIAVMVMLQRDGTVANVQVGQGEDRLDSVVAEINALPSVPPPVSAALAAN